MGITENILSTLIAYNTLIKYQIKAYKERVLDAKPVECFGENMFLEPDTFIFEILEIIQKGNYSTEFIHLLNRAYQLSQSNSDLLAEYSPVIKQLNKNYPITKKIEKLSFGVFDFLYNDIFEARNEFEPPFIYTGFEDINTEIPEYWFKDDITILWKTYYLFNSIINAFVKQNRTDFTNQIGFIGEEGITHYIEETRKEYIRQITLLSDNFCDRNFIFCYLQGNSIIEKEYLVGYCLSDMLEKLNTKEYAEYIELDYSMYPANYNWKFEKKSLKNYSGLYSLPFFERLVNLLTSIFSLKELEKVEIIEEHTKTIQAEIDLPEKTGEPETEEIEETPLKKGIKKEAAGEYILSVPILDLLYQHFNEILWYDITLVEFLGMFTTYIQKQDNFKLKPKQTARFYYLLKKIWINSSNTSFFDTEKEWIIPFLKNYGLSYSAYTNQFIKNEGGLKHRDFIRETDKILPKDEIE